MLIPALFVITSCITAGKMLEWAENAWHRGEYATAINQALNSYEKALAQDTHPDEAEAALSFLVQRFPEANANLSQAAERQLAGSDAEKINAWKTYEVLVALNKRVKDSKASLLLPIEDFTGELTKAKELASQQLYGQVLEHMGKDTRDSYIKAAILIDTIQSIIPGYRDIQALKAACIKVGTVTIAFSDRAVSVNVRWGQDPLIHSLEDEVYDEIRNFIEARDYPDFLSFVSSPSLRDAADQGVDYFVELSGEISVAARKTDNYSFEGTVTWERFVEGFPRLSVTRLSDRRHVTASASVTMRQAIEIAFYPEKNDAETISASLYNNQFNSSHWMNIQLTDAERALEMNNATAKMTIWAEMQLSGSVKFLETAEITESGEVKPISWDVYSHTDRFINGTLTKFLYFGDINLSDRLVDIMTKAYTSDAGIKAVLGNL